MTKHIDDLRKILFEAAENLTSGKIDVDRAKTIAAIGQTIINSAKVEVDYIRSQNGAIKSEFLGDTIRQALPSGVNSITQHRIKG